MSETLLQHSESALLAEPRPGQLLARNPRRLQRSSYRHLQSFPIRWSDLENGVVSRVGMAQFYEGHAHAGHARRPR